MVDATLFDVVPVDNINGPFGIRTSRMHTSSTLIVSSDTCIPAKARKGHKPNRKDITKLSRNVCRTIIFNVKNVKSAFIEIHGISHHLVWILQLIYTNQLGEVQREHSNSDPRPIHAGLRQGCVLSPRLFCSVLQ